MTEGRDRRRDLLAAAAVALAAAAAFALAVRSGFVWDDAAFLPAPERLRAVTDPSEFFRAGVFAFSRFEQFSGVPIYRPTTVLVVWLLAPVLGNGPAGWHVLPIVLHVACSVLVYAFARRWRPEAPRVAALAGALLFALLPCHAEAVAYVQGFGNPFTTLHVLVAAHAMLSWSRTGSPASLAAAAGVASLAMFSSEAAFAVPALLLGLAWVETGRRPPWPAWCALAAATVIPIYMRSRVLAAPLPFARDAAALGRIADFAMAYVRDLLSPWPPPPYSTYPASGISGPWTWAASLLAVLAVGIWIRRLPRGDQARPLAAVGWILATMALPAIGAANPTPFYGPRALYLPSVGLALLVAEVVARMAPGLRARLRLPAVALALGAVAVGNVQATYWRDEKTVLRRMLVGDPDAGGAHVKLARILEAEGCSIEALPHFEAAVRNGERAGLKSRAVEAYAVYLAACLQRYDEAAALLEQLVRDQPALGSAWSNAGNVALLRKDARRARECYERALAIDPRDPVATANLPIALRMGGR